MPKSNMQIVRIVGRDRICGKHIDGCGKEFKSTQEATVGHIIPQSLFKTFEVKRAGDFKKDWNTQPECPDCNLRRGGQVNGWPLFKCSCHLLEVEKLGSRRRAIHIVESAHHWGPPKKHLLFDWEPEPSNRENDLKWAFENDVTVVVTRLPPRGEYIGWGRDSGGHALVPIPDRFIPLFNWLERARAGDSPEPILATNPENSSILKAECSGDTILVTKDGDLLASWPTRDGHTNLANLGLKLNL